MAVIYCKIPVLSIKESKIQTVPDRLVSRDEQLRADIENVWGRVLEAPVTFGSTTIGLTTLRNLAAEAEEKLRLDGIPLTYCVGSQVTHQKATSRCFVSIAHRENVPVAVLERSKAFWYLVCVSKKSAILGSPSSTSVGITSDACAWMQKLILKKYYIVMSPEQGSS